MIHESDQLPGIGLAKKVDHAAQRLVFVPSLADLDKTDLAGKQVYHLLIAFLPPALAGEVAFRARVDNPEGSLDLRNPAAFLAGKIEVRPIDGELQGDA
jgi:hypothetical protein